MESAALEKLSGDINPGNRRRIYSRMYQLALQGFELMRVEFVIRGTLCLYILNYFSPLPPGSFFSR